MELLVDFSKEDDKRELLRVLKTRKQRLYRIQITEHHDRRTTQQNRYYWGVVLAIISQETGYTIEEAHEEMKQLFLQKEIVNRKTGIVSRVPDSSALQDTKQFAEYIDKIVMWALTELDCYIPSPEKTIIRKI